MCDNTSAINLAKNPIVHSRTKHIEIRHHFIRDHISKGDIELQFVDTARQTADIFTKPLGTEGFNALVRELGMIRVSDIGADQNCSSKSYITYGVPYFFSHLHRCIVLFPSIDFILMMSQHKQKGGHLMMSNSYLTMLHIFYYC